MRCQHCKDVKEKVEELIPLLERFRQIIIVTKNDGDRAESQRRSEFSRCVPPIAHHTVSVYPLPSALEDIEKRSRVLLEKRAVAQLVEKGEDSAEVARLVERLREAVTHYQVSASRVFPLGTTHGRIGITTASDLQSKHQPYCMHLPSCLPTFYSCVAPFRQVLFPDALETSRGGVV